MSNFAYEMDCGWSFDGYYIPHLLTINWYFRDDPFTYKGIQKVRIHGQTHGVTNLEVAINGMQTDYLDDFTEAQYVNLPRNIRYITTDLVPTTNYTDVSGRGLAMQLQFTGYDPLYDPNDEAYDPLQQLPEPAHVIQVLAVQTTGPDTGTRVG